MKAYVNIQSSITIRVTAGLQHENVTNPDAHVPDRLKVNATWPTTVVKIKKGHGVYPSEITEWPTVKALAKDKLLTIGEFVDSATGEVVEVKKSLAETLRANNKVNSVKDIKLNDVAGK